MRNYNSPEPTKPYKTTIPCAQAPVGLGALANSIGTQEKPWQYPGNTLASTSGMLAPWVAHSFFLTAKEAKRAKEDLSWGFRLLLHFLTANRANLTNPSWVDGSFF